MLARSRFGADTRSLVYRATTNSSTKAKVPKPRETPKLKCRQETPTYFENTISRRIRPTWMTRTQRCTVVTDSTSGPSAETELAAATTIATRTITKADHLKSTEPKSLAHDRDEIHRGRFRGSL